MRCATAMGSIPVNSSAMSSVSSWVATSCPKIASFTRTGPNSAAFLRMACRIASELGSGPVVCCRSV